MHGEGAVSCSAGLQRMTRSARPRNGSLVAIDGITDAALLTLARSELSEVPRRSRGGISRWDASGVFEELSAANEEAGRPSARTLLLLYAADLVFRLRWQIRPQLAEGRTVVAAPYVATAVAFGRAAGLPAAWLSNLFRFAPRANASHVADSASGAKGATDGFVPYSSCASVPQGGRMDRRRLALVDRAALHLRRLGRAGSRSILPQPTGPKARRQARLRAQRRFTDPSHRRGLLVVFEGPDGSGKTTQRKLFRTWLESQGYDTLTTKWNSSELVKPIIRTRKALHTLSPEEFSLLHAADFRHRMDHVILPALWDGKLVIADRFLFTGLARDVARGLDLDWVLNLYQPLLWPDLVFYFSVSADTSGRRVAATRTPNFYEAGLDVTDMDDPVQSYHRFIARVIREYEALAPIFNFVTVDAEESISEQHNRLRELFREGERRPWSKWNTDALADWLIRTSEGR
jgi:dTMP kinase